MTGRLVVVVLTCNGCGPSRWPTWCVADMRHQRVDSRSLVSRPAYSTRLGRVAARQGSNELSEAHKVAVAPPSLADRTV